MNDYRIIEEHIIEFRKNSQLIVMLINDRKNLHIEVTSRSELIGRKTVHSYNLGIKALDYIFYKLYKMPNYISAKSLCQQAFSFERIQETLFLINLIGLGTISKKRIHSLMNKYRFEIEEEFHFTENENCDFERHLHIKFPFKNLPIGKFIGIYEIDEYMFIMNPDY